MQAALQLWREKILLNWNFDIRDESNLSQRWKKWQQIFEFYLTTSGIDDDQRMTVLLFHRTGLDVQDALDVSGYLGCNG